MKIWVTRHGQTDLNKKRVMQGNIEEPLNERGIEQAKRAAERVADVKFDAVYSSPLGRAVQTAEIIGHIDRKDIIIDDRITEVDFGSYERKSYFLLGPHMTLYWMYPEYLKAPRGVETIAQMVERSHSFLKELEQKDYENVLVVCHGGIIRAICGYFENAKNGVRWRPRPHNCEIRVYECENGKHELIADYLNEDK